MQTCYVITFAWYVLVSLYCLGGVVTSMPGGHPDQTAPHEYTPLIVG